MSDTLSGQRVVITGITGGIAFASAQRLRRMGAKVIVTARSGDKLDRSLAQLNADAGEGPAPEGHVMDLLDPASIAATFQAIGAFDHLVTPAASAQFSPIADLDLETARRLLETKQWGQTLCVHHAAGTIAKTGSITLFSGTVTQKPLPGGSMFASVGAAAEAAGRVWAFELAPVRVNTVVPGVIDTPVWGNVMGADAANEAYAHFADVLPVKRNGTPDDVAKAVAFLIDNSFVNGLSLVVDGGHRLI